MRRRRRQAWSRWLTCKRAIVWLRLARGEASDWYWTSSEDYDELRRRRFIDGIGRVTDRGRRVIAGTTQ